MSAVDREAFMRLMGLTSADVEDPDNALPRDAARGSARGARLNKVSSPVTSSAGGLSHSVSLPGEPADHTMMHGSAHNSTKTSANMRDSTRVGASFHHTKEGSGDVAPLRRSARPEYFEQSAPRSTGSASGGGGAASARAAAAACAASSRPAAASEVLKEDGNRAFEAARFTEAITHYSGAIEALGPINNASRGAELELLSALHSNRSAAYLQAARQWSSAEEAFGRALCDADRAVALRPSWFKGYARQGDAYFKLRRYGTAAEAYEMALQLDPRNTTLSNALEETRQRARQAAREEMEMRRTMRSTTNSHMSSMRSTDAGGLDQTQRSASDTLSHQSTPMWATGEATHTTTLGGARRSSGQAQQLWESLKHEVEATTNAPTGDAYRLQQLARYRKRGDGDTGAAAAAAAAATPEAHRASDKASRGEARVSQHSTGREATTTTTTTRSAVEPQRSTAPTREKTGEVSSSSRSSASHPLVEKPSALSPISFAPATSSRAGASGASPPIPPPRRSSYDSPTSGGIPAAMANFSGPVTSARDVPYEFSSAAASAYQQKLLEAFRQRKGK